MAVAVAIGKGFLMGALFLSALLHEAGHALAAEKFGYGLNRISVMPYGAELGGERADMSAADEVKVALAGPAVNAVFVVATLAVWWLAPDLYPYTEAVFSVNFSMLVTNLLPVYPLDGGRIVYALLRKKTAPGVAKKVCFWSGMGLCMLLFLVALLGRVRNFSLYVFLVTVAVGVFSVKKEGGYRKILSGRRGRMEKGVPLTVLAFLETAALSTVLLRLKAGECYRIAVFRKESDSLPVAEISDAEFYRLAEKNDLSDTLKKVLSL